MINRNYSDVFFISSHLLSNLRVQSIIIYLFIHLSVIFKSINGNYVNFHLLPVIFLPGIIIRNVCDENMWTQ